MRFWFKFILLLKFFFICKFIKFRLLFELKLILLFKEILIKFPLVFFHFLFKFKVYDIITSLSVILSSQCLSHDYLGNCGSFLHVISVLNTSVLSWSFFVNCKSVNQICLSRFGCWRILLVNWCFED